jgi:hypothetical protein
MEPLSRRGFLLRTGLVAGAGAVGLAGCTSDDADQAPAAGGATGSGTSAELSDWAAVRDQFALDPELAHFAAFVLASHPAQVRDAIDRFRNDLDRDTVAATSQEIELENAAREAAARYLGVASNEVALTDSTTMGLGLTYHGLTLRADDHVVTSTTTSTPPMKRYGWPRPRLARRSSESRCTTIRRPRRPATWWIGSGQRSDPRPGWSL